VIDAAAAAAAAALRQMLFDDSQRALAQHGNMLTASRHHQSNPAVSQLG